MTCPRLPPRPALDFGPMENGERDSTQDWVVPTEAAPPLLGELELKVDEALAVARASEDAVSAVGAAALDAAEQARRAAELAERASAAALDASRAVATREAPASPPPPAARPALPASAGEANGSPEPARPAGPDPDEALRRFVERADRVAARLRAV